MEDWREDSFFAKEDDYNDFMSARVTPWLEREVRQGDFSGKGGVKIHYYYDFREDARATIVICHGYCEFFSKYHELMYYFSQAGYNVFYIEHRGFGYSDRLGKNPLMVHVASFDDYVEDMHILVNEEIPRIVGGEQAASGQSGSALPMYLYCHSMGGCIGTLYAEKYPHDFDRIVLSSPMLSLSWGGTPRPALLALFVAKRITGGMEEYMPGQGDYVVGTREFPTSSGQSEVRYEYFMGKKDREPAYQLWGGSISWGRAAFYAMDRAIRGASAIAAPTILFSAGNDTVVTSEGQQKLVEKNPNIGYKRFEGAKHELYNALPETRIPYIREVLEFFAEDEDTTKK